MSKQLDEFPISISAYIADTTALSTIQHGAYLLLLMTMRRAGGWVQDDDRKLANIVKMSVTKWRQIAPDIRELLVAEGGKLSQKRIISDIEKLKALSAKNAENGKSGGIAKSLKNKTSGVATARISPSVAPPNAPVEGHDQGVSAISSLFESDSKEESKKGNSRGSALPGDWVPGERDYAYAAKLGLTVQEADACAEDMRLWARANANRAVGRKADWGSTYHGWMRREAPKVIRQRQFNQGGGTNGTDRNNRGPRLGAAGIAQRLRQSIEERERAGGSPEFFATDDREPDDGRGNSPPTLGRMDRAGPTASPAPRPGAFGAGGPRGA